MDKSGQNVEAVESKFSYYSEGASPSTQPSSYSLMPPSLPHFYREATELFVKSTSYTPCFGLQITDARCIPMILDKVRIKKKGISVSNFSLTNIMKYKVVHITASK